MKQHKKVSDFLIDEKVSIDKKDDVSVLESGDEIVWIVGMRIADPFKVTAKTKCVLQIGTNVWNALCGNKKLFPKSIIV